MFAKIATNLLLSVRARTALPGLSREQFAPVRTSRPRNAYCTGSLAAARKQAPLP